MSGHGKYHEIKSMADVVHGVDSASKIVRSRVMTALVALVKEDPRANIQTAFTVLLRAIASWNDRRTLVFVEKAITELLSIPLFAPTWAKALYKYIDSVITKRGHPEPDPRAALRLHHLLHSFLVAVQPADLSSITKLEALVLCDCDLLEVLPRSSHPAITSLFKQLMGIHPSLLDIYTRGSQRGSNKLTYMLTTRMVLSFVVERKDLVGACKPTFVKSYSTNVLASPAILPDRVHSSFMPLFRVLDHDDFKSLAPTINRLMKRGVDIITANMCPLLQHVNLDLSRYCDGWISSILSELKHADDSRRSVALETLRALATKCSQSTVLQALMNGLAQPLSSNKLGISAKRISFVRGVDAMIAATSGGSEVFESLGAVAISTLTPLCDNKTPDVSAAAITALSHWLAALDCNASHEVKAIEVLRTGLISATSVEDFVQAASLLTAAHQEKKAVRTLSDAKVLQAMSTRIQQAIKKPSMRSQGLLAVEMLLEKAVRSSGNGGDWQGVLDDPASFVNSQELIARCTEIDAQRHRQVASHVFEIAVTHSSESFAGFFQGCIFLLLHSNRHVRQAMLADTERILTKYPILVAKFASAFHAVLLLPDISVSSSVLSNVLWRISTNALPSDVPLLAFCSHFASVCPGTYSASSAWKKVCTVIKTRMDLRSTFMDEFNTLQGYLFDQGLFSLDSRCQNAAARLIASVLRISPELMLEAILPQLLASLEPSAVEFSPYERAVLETPEGVLCTWSDNSRYKAKVVQQTRNLSEDEKWELDLRKKLAKKNKKQKEPTISPEEKAKLTEEAGIRTRLQTTIRPYISVLSAFTTIAHYAPKLTCNLLIVPTLDTLQELMLNPVVAEETKRAHSAMGNCLSMNAGVPNSVVAAAVQAVLEGGVSAFDRKDYTSPTGLLVAHVLKCVSGASIYNFLPVSSFVFCLPLATVSLTSPEHQLDGSDSALTFLTSHCSPDLPVVFKQCVSFVFLSGLVLQAHARFPASQELTHQALADVCALLSPAELSEMVGDRGLLSSTKEVRASCVAALAHVPGLCSAVEADVRVPLFIVLHDSDDELKSQTAALWTSLEAKSEVEDIDVYITLLSHKQSHVRKCAARAIGTLMHEFDNQLNPTLAKLIQLFEESPDEVVVIPHALRSERKLIERWPTRSGAVLALEACAILLNTPRLLNQVFSFLINTGLADENIEVWENSLEAGLEIIEENGAVQVNYLVALFERNIARLVEGSDFKSQEVADKVREGLIVLLGTVAKNLDSDSATVVNVIQTLIHTLDTPSHRVQVAVADCLAPLMHPDMEATDYINTCLNNLVHTDFAVRKGGAFGLGSMIKGLKPSALKTYDVMPRLNKLIDDKNWKFKEGALLAYEQLFKQLRFLFEPYAVHLLPSLVGCFGNNNRDVRATALACTRAMMSSLTAHGVRRILPIVLTALQSRQWRAKVENINLLGSMAFCAPQVLNACLPMIVPHLLKCMSDPHLKVKGGAKTAIKQIASVVRNPEILALSSLLLSGLTDSKHCAACLNALMQTTFLHVLDAPALAMLIPIIRKGLRSRIVEEKVMSLKITGSLAHLVENVASFLPYSKTLLTHVKNLLVESTPEVRWEAGRCMGNMYEGCNGEEHFPDLRDWLFGMLEAETQVQRVGAALGLAQILRVLGAERTQKMLPGIMEKITQGNAVVREGYMGLFIWLPDAFGKDFILFLSDCLPVVLRGLADEQGPVREISLRAGHSFVSRFALSHTDLLVPSLENGLSSEDWRIRLSSLELLGVLLLRLAGLNAKLYVGQEGAEEEEDAAQKVLHTRQESHIEEALGTNRRNRVFGKMYLMRSDVFPSVSEMAFRVWNRVVKTTPVMLARCLPTLMLTVFTDLASDREEAKASAGTAIENLVAKMGDDILQKMIPMLQARLESEAEAERTGVCVGLGHILAAGQKHVLAIYLSEIVSTIRDALCDQLANVRRAGGSAFITMHHKFGKVAIDEIVPSLLDRITFSTELGEEEQKLVEHVLDGVREILHICDRDVLPYLIPRLIQEPVSAHAAQSLAALSPGFGPGLFRYISRISEVMVNTMACCEDQDNYELFKESTITLYLNITQPSVQSLVESLVYLCTQSESNTIKGIAAEMIAAFCTGTSTDYSHSLPSIIQALLGLFGQEDEKLLMQGWRSLKVVFETVDKDLLSTQIDMVRQVVHVLTHDDYGHKTLEHLPGFCVKKGLSAIWPMFQHTLVHGSSEARQAAASTLNEMLDLTSDKALAPMVIKITGPLIRIVGDRVAAEVKSAILETLGRLLQKSAKYLKAFLPQLQTTFVKALHDTDTDVRTHGGNALEHLVAHSRRIDPLVSELITACEEKSDDAVKQSFLESLTKIMAQTTVGAKVSEEVLTRLLETTADLLESKKDPIRLWSGRCLGTSMQYAEEEVFEEYLDLLISDEADSWHEQDGRLTGLITLMSCASSKINEDFQQDVVDFLADKLEHDNMSVRRKTIDAASMVSMLVGDDAKSIRPIVVALIELLEDSGSDTRAAILIGLSHVAQRAPEAMTTFHDLVVPPVMERSSDGNVQVKLSAQEALYFIMRYDEPAQASALVERYCKSVGGQEGNTFQNLCSRTIRKFRPSYALDL